VSATRWRWIITGQWRVLSVALYNTAPPPPQLTESVDDSASCPGGRPLTEIGAVTIPPGSDQVWASAGALAARQVVQTDCAV